MSRYACIHGHFYQPPRENPWLEHVELQDSAKPFHDWNARITAECYGPNATSRLMTPDDKIAGIMNNYSRISFNMGPTLLAWIEQHEPAIYEAILDADRASRDLFSGHGAAIAQAYSHMILPLADRRDKETQIRWGVRDFERRFGRAPEGMWLAETAVDLETLEILAEHGIRYTILAPRQANQVRHLDGGDWHEVSDGRVDPRRAYKCFLPNGGDIALFFYDGPIAQDLAFGGLLANGEIMAARLLSAFDAEWPEPQLVHVAADGETFGHHHKKGEMALSWCLHAIDRDPSVRPTIYAEFLDLHPPQWEVRIHENSSWSCVHGIERWRSNCGCNSGMHPGWTQEWRAPLREALDWLRDKLRVAFEAQALLRDPWEARNDYIDVVLDRSDAAVADFMAKHLAEGGGAAQWRDALVLLEAQRHAMLMYTSCGWFFDEVSGIETTQILRYACRAVQLQQQSSGEDLEPGFLAILEKAPSNLPQHGNGRVVYQKHVKPAMVDLRRVGMHVAVASLFDESDGAGSVYCYDIESPHHERRQSGRMRMVLGTIRIRSRITLDEQAFGYAAIHFGDQNVNGGIRAFTSEEDFEAMRAGMRDAFDRNDVAELVRQIDKHFEVRNYSLWHLFLEEQRRIMRTIYEDAEDRIDNFYREVHQNYAPLMNAMAQMGMPLPEVLMKTVEHVLNRDLRECMSAIPVDEGWHESLLAEVERLGVAIDGEQLGFLGSNQLATLSERVAAKPLDFEAIEAMSDLLRRYNALGAPLNLWYSQNKVYEVALEQFSIRKFLAQEGDPVSERWVREFGAMCHLLGVHVL